MECILCCQEQQVIGVSVCNHNPICYKCVYKMRIISKNVSCPICKVQSNSIIITRSKLQYKEFITKKLQSHNSYPGILFQTTQLKNLFQKLTQFRCFVHKCEEEKSFTNIAFLKKHLKEKHNRFLCDVCLQYKTCVLQQHKLYSSKVLDKHLKKGDFDQWGNLVFLHPYCDFCKEYFFDEDSLKKHLGRQHYICNTCPLELYKYVYYKNYKSLETHFKMTHYLCPDPDCISKGFIVFKSASQLSAHKCLVHDKNFNQNGKTNLSGIVGFYSEGNRQQTQKIKFQDKQGINFQQQFLSLKKTKMRSLDAVDQHKDEQFDLRIYYNNHYEEDQIFEKAFANPKKQTKKNQTQKTKKKYKTKEEVMSMNTNKNQEQTKFYLENLILVRTVYMTGIDYKEFQEKLMDIFTQQKYESFSELKHNYIKKKLDVKEFFQLYLELFDNKFLAYNIWPQFIRTIQNQNTRAELDNEYLVHLKKLPKKVQNLVNSSSKYSDFFQTLLERIEINIQNRIINGNINIRNKIKMDKQRIFQMIEVIRHVKTHQMAKIKFGTNFGLSPNVIQLIEKKLIFEPLTDIEKYLNQIPQKELYSLFLYVKFCNDALHEKSIHLQKKFIKQEILEQFLDKRPHLQLKYGKRKQSMSLDQQAQYQQQMEKKKAEKALMKFQTKNFQKKRNVVMIDQQDKYDFPDLVETTKKEDKKEKVAPKTQITNEQYINTFVNQTKKPATLKKNLNQYFPDLQPKKTQVPKKQKQQQKQTPKQKPKQKPWWQQVQGKKQEQPEAGKLPGEIKREKKKKKQIIYVQGGFK